MSLGVVTITTGTWQEHCYVVHNDEKQALIIDPGAEPDRILEAIHTNQLVPLAIMNTHAHYDHVGAIAALKQELAIPFYLHSNDRKLLKQANLYITLFDGEQTVQIPEIDYSLDEVGTPIILGAFSVRPMWTPGHTPGGVSFMIEDRLFVGDTLLHDVVGRVDLPGGDAKALDSSLKLLGALAPQTCIYPGHGALSTIGDELTSNQKFIDAVQ